jgi:broad specificity phosphatase PhoE
MIRSLYLVRHGETDANAEGRTISTTDPALNDRGTRQAHEVARNLADVKLDLILTSPRRRCTQTANIIANQQAAGPPVQADERLVELGLGAFEGSSVAELQANGLGDVFKGWRQGIPPAFPPGAEHFDTAAARMSHIFDAVLSSDAETALLVGHSHTLRILIATRVLGGTSEMHRRLFLDNASVTRVFWEDTVPRLAILNGSSPIFTTVPPVARDLYGGTRT